MKCFSFTRFIKTQTFNNIRKNYLKRSQQNFSCSSRVCDDKLVEGDSDRSAKLKEEKDIFKPSEEKHLSYAIPEEDKELVEKLQKGDIFYPYNGPLERAYKIFTNDLKRTGRVVVDRTTGINLGDLEPTFFPRHTDILIIGSGAIGLSIAYAMRTKFPHGPAVIVIDKEEEFPSLSTNLGQGNLTQQLCKEDVEVQMSKYCTEFLANFHLHSKVDGCPSFNVSYEPLGTLVLGSDDDAEDMVSKTEWLNALKADCRLLNCETLKRKFPWLNLDGVLCGRLGMINEGIFNPWTFLHSLKCRLYNLGTTFVRAQVLDFGPSNNDPFRVVVRLPDGTYNSIDFSICFIAAGMECKTLADKLSETNGYIKLHFPIEKRMRYEYCFHLPDGPGLNTPTVVDTDGTYFRREGLMGHYVAGVPSVPADGKEENTIYSVLENKVKPFLMKRVPQFEQLDLINGWVDSYDYNTVNNVGLVGAHPNEKRIMFASGFANHGIQFAPAIGRGLIELLLYNAYRSINLDCFSFENLYRKQHIEVDKKRQEKLEADERIALTD